MSESTSFQNQPTSSLAASSSPSIGTAKKKHEISDVLDNVPDSTCHAPCARKEASLKGKQLPWLMLHIVNLLNPSKHEFQT